MVRRFNSRFPTYPDDADYTTNAPSYYDALARFSESLRLLTERMKDVEQRFKDLILEWLEDGTLAGLLEQVLLDDYATKDFVKALIDGLQIDDYAKIEWVEQIFTEHENEFIDFVNDMNEILNNDNVSYTVGADGDFTTLNNALDHVRKLIIKPEKVKITLLDDYVLRDQVTFINENMGYIEITSIYSTTISINPDAIKKTIDNILPVFYGINSVLPVFNVMFEYTGSKEGNNKYISGMGVLNSNVFIKKNRGFNNFPFIGLYGGNNSDLTANGSSFINNGTLSYKHGAGIRVSRSNLTAQNSLASDCGEYGYWIQEGSSVNVNSSTANRCGHHNLVISQGSTGTARNSTLRDSPDNAVVVTTNSSLDLSGSNCSGCGNNNVVVQLNSSLYFADGISNNSGISGLNVTKHSFASAQNVTLKNNTSHGLDSKDGSDVNILGATITGNGSNGIYCLDGSHVAGRGSTINNNTQQGVYCYGGNVDVYEATIHNNGVSGIRSFNGGRVTADESDIQKNGDYGLHASRGEIWANRGICKNNEGEWDIGASWGGEITCSEVEVSSSGETIRCTSSSIIKAPSVKGSARANKTPNEINDQGVIYSDNIIGNDQ